MKTPSPSLIMVYLEVKDGQITGLLSGGFVSSSIPTLLISHLYHRG
ncbi:hypothetical protein [Thalassotalea euphylliae]|nr:hypothetical protein [Thalassotalea euphylliae]